LTGGYSELLSYPELWSYPEVEHKLLEVIGSYPELWSYPEFVHSYRRWYIVTLNFGVILNLDKVIRDSTWLPLTLELP